MEVLSVGGLGEEESPHGIMLRRNMSFNREVRNWLQWVDALALFAQRCIGNP